MVVRESRMQFWEVGSRDLQGWRNNSSTLCNDNILYELMTLMLLMQCKQRISSNPDPKDLSTFRVSHPLRLFPAPFRRHVTWGLYFNAVRALRDKVCHRKLGPSLVDENENVPTANPTRSAGF